VWVRFVGLDVDAASRRWTWRVSRGPVTMTLQHGIDPTDAGSRAWLQEVAAASPG
jgi:hypothetical protein